MSRLLVVEDEAHLANGLRFNLEAEGHSVQVVGDGESAMERLVGANEKFDAVVLDVMLPGMDGFALASELRKAQNYVPVLMLTARGRPEDVLNGFAAGADDYLPKPFELPIFLARLQGLLRRSAWLTGSHAAPPAPVAGAEKGAPERAALDDENDTFSFDGPHHRFRQSRVAQREGHYSIDPDGSKTSAAPDSQQGTHRFPQIDSRRCLGIARGHRHARHRQFHRPAAPLHRDRSFQTASTCSPCEASATASFHRTFARRPARRVKPSPNASNRLVGPSVSTSERRSLTGWSLAALSET